MVGRVRLTVEVVMYRIEEWQDPDTQEWINEDADCTSEEIVAEGTVQTLTQTETTEGTTWYDTPPTQDEQERENRLQVLADKLYNDGCRLAGSLNVLPTGS